MWIRGAKAGLLTEDDVHGERGFLHTARVHSWVGFIIHAGCCRAVIVSSSS